MAAICNGIAAYGALIPFGATFLNFIGYAQGAARLSALSHFRVLYIMTHDSIGLGEDGPTHQPVEILALLRATPNMQMFRPADGNEVSAAYLKAIENRHKPSVLALTRQGLPQLEGSSVEKASKGGYVLQDFPKDSDKFDITLVGTGSEVSLCVDAAKVLAAEGKKVRVVSLPCWEVFEEQPDAYKKGVFVQGVPVLSVEAASTFGWEKYAHGSCGVNTFGASAPIKDVYKKFGLVPNAVAEKAKSLVKLYEGQQVPYLLNRLQ
jgi:transketolase